MSLLVEIAALVIAFCSVSVILAVALGRSAKRADEQVDGRPELAEIATSLRPLSRERSPSGRRFFPTPHARRELAELVHDALEVEVSPGPR